MAYKTAGRVASLAGAAALLLAGCGAGERGAGAAADEYVRLRRADGEVCYHARDPDGIERVLVTTAGRTADLMSHPLTWLICGSHGNQVLVELSGEEKAGPEQGFAMEIVDKRGNRIGASLAPGQESSEYRQPGREQSRR